MSLVATQDERQRWDVKVKENQVLPSKGLAQATLSSILPCTAEN